MEWVLRSPQIHSTFGNLGFAHADGYHVNENCNGVLESILHNILSEDKYLRTYRRSISFGQNIQKDLIPLLIHAKDDKTIELLVKILVNLTIPVECLLSVEVMSKTDFGRHTIFEINNLLAATKTAFTDHRVTRIVIEFLKKNIEVYQKKHLPADLCANINNCLLLLRNVLHIPEGSSGPNYKGPSHTVQNQVLWNIFSQSIDKILIKLMTVADAAYWGVTMVQLIALLYKDQHVVTLTKLLNLWFDASLSESSEDNESNTSLPDRGSEDSSLILTSDPTSDSSDTGASGKSNDETNSTMNGWNDSSVHNSSDSCKDQTFQPPLPVDNRKRIRKSSPNRNKEEFSNSEDLSENRKYCDSSSQNISSNEFQMSSVEKKGVNSENSDCRYGTQIENQESISTSSNEDELPSKKPVHQKPHNPKQRANTKVRIGLTLQESKRKKNLKRGKLNSINVQGLSNITPTDDDISNILKEFTVHFLLKGYNSLVHTLHNQILTNPQLEIDTSHFFWLVTYFLKFAAQIELDVEHVSSVLSFEIVSYFTAEGVNLCEQLEIAIKLDGTDLKPSIRRLHLVVTAIREFVQAIEVYKKFSHICKDDQEALVKLQIQMCETEELRSLLVLLLRHYNPKYHSKQYLQDLVVTNHILLMFLDSVMKLPDYKGSASMLAHIKQFATPGVMYQYGVLLEDYAGNGQFVNDCIFTLMHHVGGDLNSLNSLFQPRILKTFTSIWHNQFEVSDDWSDLIEYVIITFIKKPQSLQSKANFRVGSETFDDRKVTKPESPKQYGQEMKKSNASILSNSCESRWNENELSFLNWNYMQCKVMPDVVGEMVKLFKEDGVIKSRESILQELFKQNTITKDEYDNCLKSENEENPKTVQLKKEMRDDEISKLCEQLSKDGKSTFLDWVQKVLLDTCYVKIHLDKKAVESEYDMNLDANILNFELFKKKNSDLPVLSPVSYHSLLMNKSVPLVPYNCEQTSICKDLKFLQLLHKLGFNMPVDTGKVFIRIPHFWTADVLYEVAGKISYVDTSKLKILLSELSVPASTLAIAPAAGAHKPADLITTPEVYQIHKQKHFGTMVNFTPMPGSSYNSESGNGNQNWLDIIQQSQESKITCNVESACETASVASDLTRMYVSDEDEKPEEVVRPRRAAKSRAADGRGSEPDVQTSKRPRVQFTVPL